MRKLARFGFKGAGSRVCEWLLPATGAAALTLASITASKLKAQVLLSTSSSLASKSCCLASSSRSSCMEACCAGGLGIYI